MFKSRRQHRYEVLENAGYLPFEARELSGVRYSEAPYLRKMIRDREKIKRIFDKEADFNNWSKTRRASEYRLVIRQEYLDNRWIRVTKEAPLIGRTAYHASPWEMLKTYRQRAIDMGEYHPPKSKHIRKVGSKIYIHIYKGDAEAQKARYRSRLQAKRGTPEYDKYLRQRREQKRRAREREKLR